MADKFINQNGLREIKTYIDDKDSGLQETLVSGTNIKTINGQSLLGQGNIDIDNVFVATYGQTNFSDIENAINNGEVVVVKGFNQHNQGEVYVVSVFTKLYGGTIYLTCVESGMSNVIFFGTNINWQFMRRELQERLADGLNIKTINNESLLGSGNLSLPTKTYIDNLVATKQDTLVSGTNIKTINNESLLGSGNITTFDDVFVATYNTTAFSELASAITGGKSIILKNINNSNVLFDMVVNMSSLGTSGINLKGIVYDQSTVYKVSVTVSTSNVWSNTFEEVLDVSTDNDYGVVKLNSSESVTLNSDGQLDIGGRLGQMSNTTGIFHSKDRQPRNVGDFSFLITDAIGMNLSAPRDFALVTGVNIQLNKSHPAGSTTYTVANNYANRIACAVLANGGYLSQSEAYSKENQIVQVTSVKINGQNYTPDSSVNDSSKPITITVATSANPTTAVTQLRAFGGVTGGYCSEYIGQCVGGTLGASLAIGQRVYSSSNVNCIVAADVYNTGNGNAIFGRQHISRKNRSLLAGTGHDTTNAKSEGVVAFGDWSDLSSPEILFAVGDGTSHTDRSNALEVRNRCIVLKSPNGTKWKITVDNDGNLTTTAI